MIIFLYILNSYNLTFLKILIINIYLIKFNKKFREIK